MIIFTNYYLSPIIFVRFKKFVTGVPYQYVTGVFYQYVTGVSYQYVTGVSYQYATGVSYQYATGVSYQYVTVCPINMSRCVLSICHRCVPCLWLQFEVHFSF